MAYNKNDKIEASPTRNKLEFEKIRLDFETLINNANRHCDAKTSNGTAVLASTERIRTNRQKAEYIPNTTSSFANSTSAGHTITAIPVSNAMRGVYYLLKNNYMLNSTSDTNVNNAISAVLANGNPVQFTKIPALTPYLTVLTYWNNRSNASCRTWAQSSNETKNITGCNAACLGFCAGNCYGTSYEADTSTTSKWGSTHCNTGKCKSVCGGQCQKTCGDYCGDGSGCCSTCTGGTR